MPDAEPEKFSDINMYLFIEKGLRGAISYIAKMHSKVNNKYMKTYDPTKLLKFKPYVDINNLYGWGMSGYFPGGGFKSLKNADNFGVNSISENSSIGYTLEVDLSILRNYTHYTMIIHLLQKNLQFLMACCQIIVKILLKNME